MSLIPGLFQNELDDIAFLITHEGRVAADDVLLASGQTSALTPDFRMPKGMVVVKDTASGNYYQADGATGDRSTGAQVQSAQVVDGDWNGATLTFDTHGGQVTFVSASSTTSALVSALNGDADFAALMIATGSDVEPLGITTKKVGAEAYVKATSDIDAAGEGFGEGGADGAGLDADYRVTSEFVDLQRTDGTATEALVATLYSGHFRLSALSNLTAEAKAVLSSRGARFG